MAPDAFEAWSPIYVGDNHYLIYGPRLGRSYLLPENVVTQPSFLQVAGLSRAHRYDALLDPAGRIARTLQNFGDGRGSDVSVRYVLGYRLLQTSRHAIPLRSTAKLIRTLAIYRQCRIKTNNLHAYIAECLHGIEGKLGTGDCYPRALMTAYLSLRSGQACRLTVGALAPTRKMHVWCSLEEVIPYEPAPEHYLYQPLWTLTLLP